MSPHSAGTQVTGVLALPQVRLLIVAAAVGAGIYVLAGMGHGESEVVKRSVMEQGRLKKRIVGMS